MQFVNVVVHSVEDMNFRVHLQYEFSKLGLDEYLEKLRHTESEELQVVLITLHHTICFICPCILPENQKFNFRKFPLEC